MKLRKHEEILFALLRHAISGVELPEETFSGCSGKDWELCFSLASEQGVMAIAWDAVNALPKELQPGKPLRIRWGLAVENYSETYSRYCRTISELSDFYAENGIRTVQLKGVGLSTYYPVPERRQGGDIDIYTYSSDRTVMTDAQANALADRLMEDRGIEVDMHSYKHSNFFFKGVPIENHKFFTNVEHYHAAAEANAILLERFNPCRATLDGKYEILIPSPEFNSIFIVMHALQHFTTGLALHHLCDWACVLKKTGQELPLRIGDKRFTKAVRAMTQMCREYLGSDVPKEEGFEEVEELIMGEILNPRFRSGEIPHNPFGIIWYKTRRFVYSSRIKARIWETSFVKSVWKSVVAHLKDPATILARG